MHGTQKVSRSSQSTRPSTLSDLKAGDPVAWTSGGRDSRTEMRRVARRTSTLVILEGSPDSKYRVGDGKEQGTTYPGMIRLPTPELERLAARFKAEKHLQYATTVLGRAIRDFTPHTSMPAEVSEQFRVSMSHAKTGLILEALSTEDSLNSRSALPGGQPFPYTDEDVAALTASLTRVGFLAAKALDKTESAYLSDAVRAFLPVRSKRALLGLMSVVEHAENSGALPKGGSHSDSLYGYLARLQGYEQSAPDAPSIPA